MPRARHTSLLAAVDPPSVFAVAPPRSWNTTRACDDSTLRRLPQFPPPSLVTPTFTRPSASSCSPSKKDFLPCPQDKSKSSPKLPYPHTPRVPTNLLR